MRMQTTTIGAALKAPILPTALQEGDTVRLVSPASWFDPRKLDLGMDMLRTIGLQPEIAVNALARHAQYSAGTAAQRLEDLHAAFADPTVKAILCNRGGYGSAELLSGLDLSLVRSNPKIVIGCSDITSLLTWLHDATGLAVFHGPMAAGSFTRENGVDISSWQAAFSQHDPWQLGPEADLRTLKEGHAQGKFYGGCLSMLVASLGTPYEIQTENTILFLEDIGAKPYQIDRMLLQLRLAGKLDHVRGIVFGPMLDCVQPGAPTDLLDSVLLRILEDFPGPVAIGLRSGHVHERNITVPIGVHCEMDIEDTPMLRFQSSVTRDKGQE